MWNGVEETMMLRQKTLVLLGALLLLAVLGIGAAETAPEREEFRANVIAPSVNNPNSISSVANIRIDRWTTDAEIGDLAAAYNATRQDGFLQVLQKLPKVGYFKMPNVIAYDLRCAMQQILPDGSRRIFLATDRALGFGEASDRTMSSDYPFTVIELRLGKDNKGEGTVSVAAKIIVSTDGKYFDLENYGPFPVMLKFVRKTK